MLIRALYKSVKVCVCPGRAALPVLISLCLLAGAPQGRAQSVQYLVPSVSVGAVYDDNIFYSPQDKVEDFILRVTPELWGKYETERTELQALYNFDSEWYLDNSDLNDVLIRQQALADWNYRFNNKLGFGLAGTFDETVYPGELSLLSGFNTLRTRARRFSITPSLNYTFNPKTHATADYSFARDRVTGAVGADLYSSGFEVEREIGRTDSAILRYRWYGYDFESGPDTDAQVPMIGWIHRFSERTRLRLAGGARFSDGSTTPEIEVAFSRIIDDGEIELTYDQNESIIVGESGTVRTRRVGAELVFAFNRNLELEIAPSYSSGKQEDDHFKIYQLNIGLNYRFDEHFTVAGSWQYNQQDGALDNRSTDEVKRNVVYVGIVYTFGSRGDRNRNTIRDRNTRPRYL